MLKIIKPFKKFHEAKDNHDYKLANFYSHKIAKYHKK